MEYSKINALSRTGENAYGLWTLVLPRELIHAIRQLEPAESGSWEDIFEALPMAGTYAEDTLYFVLPHSGDLWLVPTDMGKGFCAEHRFNGESMQGEREEIMTQLQENLRQQGYRFRPNACFSHVDVLKTLQKIMEHNTSYYWTDFDYDREMLLKAAKDRNAHKQFFWMSRHGGTLCFPERSVYIEQTEQYNSWNYYGRCPSERAMAFWIELYGEKDGMVEGDIVEMDYQEHLDYLCANSLAPDRVDLLFQNPSDHQIIDYQEYKRDWESIVRRYGTMERKTYLVENEWQLANIAAQGRVLQYGLVETQVDNYVQQLDSDRLCAYGYGAGDMALVGPQDAEKAVKQGLECFILNRDGSREPLSDVEELRKAVSRTKLFGMTAREKEILGYFRQECIPLFTQAEMRKIYFLALRAGMENEPEESELLDDIIHKAECSLPQAERVSARGQEQEALQGEAVR